MRSVLSLVLLTLIVPAAAAQEADAEKLFRDMEKRIRAARAIQVKFTYDMETGNVAGARKVAGSLILTADSKARLTMSGDFGLGNRRGTFDLISNGEQIRVTRTPPLSDENPKGSTPKFHAAASTTATRAGVYLTYLTMPRQRTIDPTKKETDPDTLRLEVYAFRDGGAEMVGERATKVITYKLGQKADAPNQAAEVTLWIDAKTLLPFRRVFVQREGKGGDVALRVTETYSEFVLDPKLDAKVFELPN